MSPGELEGVFSRDETPEDDFSIIRNGMLRDPSIPWEVKGIVANLLSHKPGYKITLDVLLRQTSSGKDATRRALEAARKAGYVYRGERIRYPEGTKNSAGKDISGALGPYQWSFTTDPDKVASLRAKYAQESAGQDQGGKPAQALTRDDAGRFTSSGNPTKSGTTSENPHQSSPAETRVFAGQHKRGKTSGSDPADNKKTKEEDQGEKKTKKTPPTPHRNGGTASGPESNEGGRDTHGGLFPIGDVLPATRTRRQPVPASEQRGGELVTLHGYNAEQVVDNWSNGLQDSSEIRGRLRTELIKQVRGLLASSPRVEERVLVDALDDFLANGETPGYMRVAFTKAQTRRARQANQVVQETARQRWEREHHERALAARAERQQRSSRLDQVRAAAWATELASTPVAPVDPLLCETCDPRNPGWLPPVDPTDPDERPRRCPHHNGNRLTPSHQQVRAFAAAAYAGAYAADQAAPDAADSVEAEVVDVDWR